MEYWKVWAEGVIRDFCGVKIVVRNLKGWGLRWVLVLKDEYGGLWRIGFGLKFGGRLSYVCKVYCLPLLCCVGTVYIVGLEQVWGGKLKGFWTYSD